MTEDTRRRALRIEPATDADVPLLLTFIRELAQHEKAPERVLTNEGRLRATLFGPRPYAEAVIAFAGTFRNLLFHLPKLCRTTRSLPRGYPGARSLARFGCGQTDACVFGTQSD
jgi:hypothetical protein